MLSEGYGTWSVCLCVCLSTAILALQATKRHQSDTKSSSATSAKTTVFETKKLALSRTTLSDTAHQLEVRVRTMGRPRPAQLPITTPRPPLTFAATRLSAFATSCLAHRGEADVQSGLPADAASLRQTGSLDRLHRVGLWPIE